MKKSDRIQELLAGLGSDPRLALHPCYQGYFTCFNAQQYYEAHDVLEHLWLQTNGPNHAYFKGLIQFAGAFVHLQKQHLHPGHPKHGRRLAPAARLFHLATTNLASYAPRHLQLDVAALCVLGQQLAEAIIRSEFTFNPWQPSTAPQLRLFPEGGDQI